MFINLKFAIKNLLKSKVATLLNILGLVTAFTAFTIIALYVWKETHFDRYHEQSTELYRIEIQGSNQDKSSVYLAGQTGQTLVNEIPEIVSYTTYMPWGKWGGKSFTMLNTSGNEISTTEDYAFADKHLTELFTFNFVDKSDNLPLNNPQTVIISTDFAKKIWGKTSVCGQSLKMGDKSYTITGVFQTPPTNTIFTAPIILKMPEEGWISKAFYNWGVVNYPQFILAKKGIGVAELNRKINEQSSLQKKYQFLDKKGIKLTVIARPIKDLRFSEDTAESPLFNTNSKTTVMAVDFVGLLIMLIAMINYLNFSVALIPQRIKNLSISRIMGGSLKNIFATTTLESTLLFIGAFALSLIIFHWLNSNFLANLIGYDFPINSYLMLIASIFAVVMIAGLLVGFYPAIKVVKVNPVEGVKGYKNRKKSRTRGVLSVFQFTATIILIALSTLIIKQIYFMKNTDIGFDKNAVLFMPIDGDFKLKVTEFGKQLANSPYVKDVGHSIRVPGVASNSNSYKYNDKSVSAWTNIVDGKYMKMMGFTIVEGRNFIADSEAENGNIICNETAARKFEWKVGDLVEHHGLKKPTYVVGIVKDFNYAALRNTIGPYVFTYVDKPNLFSNISIKLNGKNTAEALAFIRKTYKALGVQQVFQYQFLDEHMSMQYVGENRQASIITIFSLISLLISLLGVLGLSIFASERRTKEIGVRKINGASIAEILRMLNRDFIKWVVIAFVIATPIAYYAMNKWLESFAYKTALSWWIFALAGVAALAVALLTVSWQSYRAASRNPVEALRYE